jgi:hypothetical protein
MAPVIEVREISVIALVVQCVASNRAPSGAWFDDVLECEAGANDEVLASSSRLPLVLESSLLPCTTSLFNQSPSLPLQIPLHEFSRRTTT